MKSTATQPKVTQCDESCHAPVWQDTCPKCDTGEWARMCDSCRTEAAEVGER